ncbi:2-hydroxypenta-2,4-dienoate hydratase [Spiractinospora alimapuensis]|uniref:2-keto-4-pentenoate hydratase n=1 Tax=Spiractinospora alimapuensis TaxID=2820884 RepID=UPI001F24CC1B|nr:2-hydroxypenta-2,4-dienoate hydratase [Spiractinospora alimapuensis]QVQ51734.1 2-hydroxypenta-2,4-dienoate hydratase [Spiractinospora alimapuensis]
MTLDIDALADTLVAARDAGKPVTELPGATGPEATARNGFRVQQEVIRRLVDRGDRVAGFKLGNIAKAMQTQFGVDEPDYGYLLASQFHPENLAIARSGFIHPYVELEPAFVLKADLGGPYVTAADVISATDYVVPALEIIDSRVRDWRIGIFDTLADCGSSGGVVLGAQPRALSEVNLSDMPGEIRLDGAVVAQGNTRAIYGNPVSAVAWLCRRVADYGVTLRSGDVVLPGSCLAAARLHTPGTVTGGFAAWGEVGFELAPG